MANYNLNFGSMSVKRENPKNEVNLLGKIFIRQEQHNKKVFLILQ